VRVLILNAHPDEGSLCDAVAAAYVEGARPAGHDIRYIALRELRFDLVLRGGFHSTKPVELDIAQQQDSIRWCEHLVIVSPNWWWSAPALLKGYIDRVFLPGFAMRYHARFPYVEPLLRGRSARVLYTQNSPRLAGWLFRGICSGDGSRGVCSSTADFDRCDVTRCTERRIRRQSSALGFWRQCASWAVLEPNYTPIRRAVDNRFRTQPNASRVIGPSNNLLDRRSDESGCFASNSARSRCIGIE
jgi:putative NADPH-quinone reductase